jgi:hypothetical protein
VIMDTQQEFTSARRTAVLFVCAVTLCICVTGFALAQAPALAQLQRVDNAMLAKTIPEPSVLAFDISPDGILLAMLVRSTSAENAQMWLVIENVKTGEIVKQEKDGLNGAILSDYAPHVRFTRDQKFLVVQDLQRVAVLETANYTVLGKIQAPAGDKLNMPVSIVGASDSDIFAISFGTGQRGPFEVGIDPVEVLIADVSRGKLISDWQASDIPQSISPTGNFVALSDWNVNDTLLGVQIVDAKTAKKVTTLKGGFTFGKTVGYTDAIGEAVGDFLSDTQILLAPNESFDSTGHYAGRSLKEAAIMPGAGDGKILREFTPANYGPTGEMVVSANRQMFVASSCYFSPYAATHTMTLPAGAGCELLGFSLKQSVPVFEAKVSQHGLEANAGGEMLRPRVSADGSVIAIAQDDGVTVFGWK